MEKNSYERRAYESVDDGAHLGLHLKNERKTKFRQLRVKISRNYGKKFYEKFLWKKIPRASLSRNR